MDVGNPSVQFNNATKKAYRSRENFSLKVEERRERSIVSKTLSINQHFLEMGMMWEEQIVVSK
jgi:hypothetical protein